MLLVVATCTHNVNKCHRNQENKGNNPLEGSLKEYNSTSRLNISKIFQIKQSFDVQRLLWLNFLK